MVDVNCFSQTNKICSCWPHNNDNRRWFRILFFTSKSKRNCQLIVDWKYESMIICKAERKRTKKILFKSFEFSRSFFWEAIETLKKQLDTLKATEAEILMKIEVSCTPATTTTSMFNTIFFVLSISQFKL